MSVSHGGVTELALFRPDSPALPQVVSDSGSFFATAWSHDGKRLVGTKAEDLWVYSSNGESSRWTQHTHTQSAEAGPAWSPNDGWLAYTSNVTGRPEVYVQAYPGPGIPILVSTNGGVAPAWNPKGRELLYVEGRMGPLVDADQRMMSVDMATPSHPGKPVILFSFSPASLPLAVCDPCPCYSVAPNGQELFALRMLPRQPARVTQIRLVLNWFEELKRLLLTR
jgi:Tol biopolymer transport system component